MCHLILFLPAFGLSLFWVLPFNLALPLYLVVLGISFLLYFKVFQAMRQKVHTGQEAMLGRKGLVIEDIDPEGKIRCASEIWNATCRGGKLYKGEEVRIKAVQGLRVEVEATAADSSLK